MNELPHAANIALLEASPDAGADMPTLKREENSATERPLKIMMLYQDFGVMGGIERYLLQTVRLLIEDPAYEVVVACSTGGPLFQQMQKMGVRVYGLPNRGIFAKSFLRTLDVFSLFQTVQLLKREMPDLVHVHIGLQENLLWKKMGFPVVYTFHGYDTLFSIAGVTNPIKRAFKSLTQRWFQQTVRQMDALMVVSGMERQRLREEGYLAENIPSQVLHNGMDINDWQVRVQTADGPALRRNWQIPADAPCVAYFNRLDPSKCPLDFVALAKKLTRQAQTDGRPLPYFLMAGDGPLENEVKAASAELENFRMLGRCDNIPALLVAANLVVHPAAREGFGLSVVEAMAAGVPILAYHCGGPAEILGVPELSHLLMPAHDVDALAQKANSLLNLSPAELEYLRQALQRRASDFSLERFKENLTGVYRHILPKVSVILPVFNGEETILRAVRSVLNQTHANLELIVVDDGSTDKTLVLLDTVRDNRLNVLSQSNSGVAIARNFAFAHATGEWIAFIDADDVWLPEKLAVELQTARRNTVDSPAPCLVYSGYFAVNDNDSLIHKPPVNCLNGDLSQAVLEHEGLFLPSTSLVHRRVFDAVGGFKAGCYHEDRVFFIEACRNFPAFATGERLVLYRQSLSGRCRSVLKDFDQALVAELSIVETLRPILPEPEILRLTGLQKRNLLYRFLMYNYLAHAQRLAREIWAKQEIGSAPIELFQGNKGRLAKLSLGSGVNFMFAARLFIQGLTQALIAPLWSRRINRRITSGLHASTNTF